MPKATAPTFDPAAAAGFAATVLYATADTCDDIEHAAAQAMANLAETTGTPLDLAAGILLATSTLLANVTINPEDIRAAADRYRDQAQEETQS